MTSAVPASLKTAARDYSKRDNWHNWCYLALDWAIIAGVVATYWTSRGIAVYLLGICVIGSRMRALANLVHESAHFKLFFNRRLNTCVGAMFCAWPLAMPYGVYARQHPNHHRGLWRTADDPDLILYQTSRTEYASDARMSYGRFLVLHVLLAILPVQTLRRLVSGGQGRRIVALLAVVGAAVALEPVAKTADICFLRYWLVPWFTSYQTISYWAELGEHGGLRSLGPQWGSRNWCGSVVSRHVLSPHSDDRYHLLHHLFPAVPHYRLKAFDRACRRDWPDYRTLAPCSGFFVARRGRVCVLRDVWNGGSRRVAAPTS